MTQLTAQELALLRSRPHSTKLWLSIYKPDTVLSGQVNDASITVGETAITYDNGSGSSLDVRSGHTMLVGTSAGKADIGRLRVRSASPTVINVAENSHINWQNDLYLTVVDFFEIWPIFPIYDLDANTGVVTVYKDLDIQYTNQNEQLGAFVCMGSHYAGWTGDQVYFTATGTFDVNNRSLSYLWFFPGGSPASSAVHTPGLVTYATPGHYTARLVVSTPTGTSDTSHRHISIYDRPDEGGDMPILRWEMDSPAGSREEGGYSFNVIIYEDVDDIIDGSLVVIFGEDFYADTKQSIGGNSENRETIKFVGYIRDGSIQYDYQHSTVEFEVVSPTIHMQDKETPSVSVDSSNDIAASAAENKDSQWYYIKNMNVTKALYHWFRWHTTVLLCCDFRYIGTDFDFQYFETDPSSLYDSIQTFLQNSLLGRLTSDRQANLWAELEVPALNNATGTLSTEMEILKQDWMDEPEVTEILVPPLSYIEAGGVAYSGDGTGTSTAYLAEAPGRVASYWGKSEGQQGLILTSQGFLNTLTGNLFAYKNARYPEVLFRLSGNYGNFDIAPLSQIPITLRPEDTRRGLTWTRKPFHISEMEWEYDPALQTFIPEIVLHEITQGYAGATVDIPEPTDPNDPTIPIVDPVWPIIPIGPPGLPPPTIPINPPTGDCLDQPNGPFGLSWVGEIRSDGERTQTLWANPNPPCGGGFSHRIRGTTFSNYRTKLVVYGCWEQSDDNGVSWDAWTDAGYARARAIFYSPPTDNTLTEYTKNHSGGTARCEGRTFDLHIPFTLNAAAQAYQFELDEGPQVISGPAAVDIVFVGSGAKISSYEWRADNMEGNCGSVARADYQITYADWASLGTGRIHATFTMYNVEPDGHTINGGGHDASSDNASFTPSTTSLSFEQYTGDGAIQTQTSNFYLPSGDTVYMGHCAGTGLIGAGEVAWFRLTQLQWERQSDGMMFDLWGLNAINRIHRVTISKTELYNICPC